MLRNQEPTLSLPEGDLSWIPIMGEQDSVGLQHMTNF